MISVDNPLQKETVDNMLNQNKVYNCGTMKLESKNNYV